MLIKLINSRGEFIGTVPLKEAIKNAQTENLDLIKINNKEPYIYKICNSKKYTFNTKKNKKKSTRNKIKKINIKINITDGDLIIKIKKTIEFLKKNNSVQLLIVLKGREKQDTTATISLTKTIENKIQKKTTYNKTIKKTFNNTIILLTPKK